MREHVDLQENRFFVRILVDDIADAKIIERAMINVLPSEVFVKVNPLPEKKMKQLLLKKL
jgi:formyltetrahydrofolate deformylase